MGTHSHIHTADRHFTSRESAMSLWEKRLLRQSNWQKIEHLSLPFFSLLQEGKSFTKAHTQKFVTQNTKVYEKNENTWKLKLQIPLKNTCGCDWSAWTICWQRKCSGLIGHTFTCACPVKGYVCIKVMCPDLVMVLEGYVITLSTPLHQHQICNLPLGYLKKYSSNYLE